MQTHFIIMSGAAGFFAASAVCLITGKPFGASLVSATIATLAFAVVGRWWARMLLFSLQQAKVEQSAEDVRNAESEAESESPIGPKPAPATTAPAPQTKKAS